MDTTVVIIGAGQAGLAMSRCLTDRSVEHVLLERGAVADAWRTARWDSLRLLTPNWMTRLPGHAYAGDDPDGYMTAAQVADFLDGYRTVIDAPVHAGVTVTAVRPTPNGFTVDTDQGPWRCRTVVVATGAARLPRIPKLAELFPDHVEHRTPAGYRNPGQVADGPVLVVGASASGVQLADELRRSDRDVLLAVGDHVRLPRTYRGMDIHWWLDALGVLDERIDDVGDPTRARRLPSLQLIGSLPRRTLDLNTLRDVGVEPVGRLVGVAGATGQFSGGFAHLCASADLKMGRLLDRIDAYATTNGLDTEIAAPGRPAPTRVGRAPTTVDLREIRTVVWATGFRPHHPELPAAALDRRGEVRHDRGVAALPGLYVLGLPFLRRRKSSFLDGVGADATELADHLIGHLDRFTAPATVLPSAKELP